MGDDRNGRNYWRVALAVPDENGGEDFSCLYGSLVGFPALFFTDELGPGRGLCLASTGLLLVDFSLILTSCHVRTAHAVHLRLSSYLLLQPNVTLDG